ncbi:hypothetical protein [Mycobacterium sp.]|uniref:hypothetical protein n=1 Tax=Mycobacterium sp. TaxID=1785 RepID=UPI0031D49627
MKITNKIALEANGYQVVNRNNKEYVRRKPKRLTGLALASAIQFGKLNIKHRNEKGIVIKPNGTTQNLSSFISALEMKGYKIAHHETLTQKFDVLLNNNNKIVILNIENSK